MRTLLVAAALLMLAGCSPSPGSLFSRANDAWGTGTFPVSNDGQAALYIVRDAAPPESPAINITVGRQPLVGLTAPNWVRLDLPPKLYDLRAYGTDQQRADHHRGARPVAVPAGAADANGRCRAFGTLPGAGPQAGAQGRAAVDAGARRQLLIGFMLFRTARIPARLMT
jgi:hypothetical protein